MKDTLVNQKREHLSQHKMQSTVLQEDIAVLSEQRDTVAKKQRALAKEVASLEGSLQAVEAEMGELSKVSTIQNGRINLDHAKRKKRLDGQFEALVEQISDKREHLTRMEEKVAELDKARQAKEEELRKLETELVQLLVDQQKALLRVLSVDDQRIQARSRAGRGEQDAPQAEADAAPSHGNEVVQRPGSRGSAVSGGTAASAMSSSHQVNGSEPQGRPTSHSSASSAVGAGQGLHAARALGSGRAQATSGGDE